jgi:hypothetical protein
VALSEFRYQPYLTHSGPMRDFTSKEKKTAKTGLQVYLETCKKCRPPWRAVLSMSSYYLGVRLSVPTEISSPRRGERSDMASKHSGNTKIKFFDQKIFVKNETLFFVVFIENEGKK